MHYVLQDRASGMCLGGRTDADEPWRETLVLTDDRRQRYHYTAEEAPKALAAAMARGMDVDLRQAG